MQWPNFHHLLYFWTVARTGSIVAAGEELRLAQPTISGQIRQLEDTLGVKLFQKSGRGLALTDVGRVAYRYADEMFTLGREMTEVVRGQRSDVPARLRVGIADAVPKTIAYQLLAPVLELDEPVELICVEGKPDRLIAELAIHNLDVVLSDAPMPKRIRVRAFNHPLVTSTVSLFAPPRMATRLRKGYPKSLDSEPLLLPSLETSIRPLIDRWLEKHDLHPSVVGEFDDSALMKVFGEHGSGAFFAPTEAIEDIERYYRVRQVAEIEELTETFYAVSIERRIRHPAVMAISEHARGGGD